MLRSIKRWWQANSGQQETPFDGDAPFWVVSMLFHLGILCALTFLVLPGKKSKPDLELAAETKTAKEDELSITKEFHSSEEFKEEMGAQSENGEEMALSQDITIARDSLVKMPLETFDNPNAEFMQNDIFDDPKAYEFETLPVKGFVGESTTGAEGAIDQITHEIRTSVQERKTLVVWLFDQSASLIKQRESISKRISRIYEELNVIEASGDKAFEKDRALLTSVYSFGSKVIPILNPSDSLSEIKESVEKVQRDDTGVENVFTAIHTVVKKFEHFRSLKRATREPERNVMVIVVTDEAGDDLNVMDKSIKLCRSKRVPVYVIGVPAPFGRRETPVKWVDPDPEYDQTPQWTTVNQGPESMMPERIKLHFGSEREDTVPVDSGFGPFGLTRLCYETGGRYFAVHPNRDYSGRLKRRNVEEYSAHLAYFFDSDIMQKYKPDYTSAQVYWDRVNSNRCRSKLVEAAQQSWVTPMKEPQLRFPKENEAAFVTSINLAQQSAAVLSPQVDKIYNILKQGEADRPEEVSPRWRAGFDLAMGRVMAVKVRTDSYNTMLAKAKTGLKPTDPRTNVWNLVPSDEVNVGSRMKKFAEKAKEYLQRVVDDHPNTPWGLMAQRELDTPIGWKWEEEYLPPPPPVPRNAVANNNNPPPRPNIPRPARNEKAKMLAKPKMRRPPPKL